MTVKIAKTVKTAKMINFVTIAQALKNVFGKDVLRVVNDSRAFVVNGNTTLAIVDIENECVIMSLRATLTPNDAGLISAAIALTHPLLIEDNFEIVEGGKIVIGREAQLIAGPRLKSLNDMTDEQEHILDIQKSNPN